MVLPDKEIRNRYGMIFPFSEERLNPASYDLSLSDQWLPPGSDLIVSPSYFLEPGEVVLASTLERVSMPRDLCAMLILKSSAGRKWLNHLHSGWIDPSFRGTITLELVNEGISPIELRAGISYAQLVFLRMTQEPEVAYGEQGSGSHYQDQAGPTRAYDDV